MSYSNQSEGFNFFANNAPSILILGGILLIVLDKSYYIAILCIILGSFFHFVWLLNKIESPILKKYRLEK